MIWFLLIALYVAAGVLWGHLLLSRKSHASMILWTCWLWLFPPLGIPLYLVLGTEKIQKERIQSFEQMRCSEEPRFAEEEVPELLQYLSRVDRSQLSSMSPPELLWGGDAFYDALENDISSAQTFVQLQTYVWRDDASGERILSALEKAAGRGVQVRVLIDEMGSMATDSGMFDRLVEEGGRFSFINTVQTRRTRFFFNLRNHRKLCILDGTIAYVGGMNIGEEYAGRAIGPWTDLQMRFTGPLLCPLQQSFAEDWYYATNEKLDDPAYTPLQEERPEEIPVVMVQSGPDHHQPIYLKSFQLVCSAAREKLDVFTPYFVPDPSILVTLQTACARGVRVRMMIPTLNEHQYMVDIGRAYYEAMMESGVEIYELPGRVNHTKAFRVDEDMVFAGSHNLDVRSYKLNFELSLCFQHRKTCSRMDEVFEDLFDKADRVDPEAFAARPLSQKLKQGVVKLFGPVL